MRVLPVACLTGLVLASLLSAAKVDDPRTGLALDTVGWKHKWDEADNKVLWIAPPGGMRIKVELRLDEGPWSKERIADSYRTDGRALQHKYTDVEPIQKPTQRGSLGKQPAWAYVIRYRVSAEEVGQSRTWLAAGPSKDPDKQLHVKVLIFGREQLFETHKEGLKTLLASLTWPPAGVKVPQSGKPGEKDPVIAGTGPGPTPTRVVLGGGTTKPTPKLVDSDTIKLDDGTFERGSATGDQGFMAEMAVGTAEDARRAQATFGATYHERTQAEEEAAAARMGFKNAGDGE